MVELPRSKELKISIDTKNLEEMNRRLIKTEEERDSYKDKLVSISEQLLEKKRLRLGCNDISVDTPEKLMLWEQSQLDLIKNNKDDPVGRGGSGVIPLSKAQTGGKSGDEFSSIEELVDSLRNRSSVGDENAKVLLNELMSKVVRGLKEEPRKLSYEFKGKVDAFGHEQGLIQKINENYQKRVKLRGGKPENED